MVVDLAYPSPESHVRHEDLEDPWQVPLAPPRPYAETHSDIRQALVMPLLKQLKEHPERR